MNDTGRRNLAGRAVREGEVGNPIVSVIRKNGNECVKGTETMEPRRYTPRKATCEERSLDYVQKSNPNVSLACNYLPMSVGWQPDLISLSEQLQRYDSTIATLDLRLKEMAKLTAEVASRVGLPFQNFLAQQGLQRQEESRSRSRSKKRRSRSVENKK